MADFLDCIRTRKDPRCPVEMGLAHSVVKHPVRRIQPPR